MGNVDSRAKFKHGYLMLQVDQPFVYSGGEIKGNAFLQLDQPFPAVQLSLKIKGKEKVHWTEHKTRTVRDGEGKTKTEHYTVHRSDERKVIETLHPLFMFPSRAALPGQYTFPFSTVMPGACPSSLYYRGPHSSRASVKYSIRVILEPGYETGLKPMEYK